MAKAVSRLSSCRSEADPFGARQMPCEAEDELSFTPYESMASMRHRIYPMSKMAKSRSDFSVGLSGAPEADCHNCVGRPIKIRAFLS